MNEVKVFKDLAFFIKKEDLHIDKVLFSTHTYEQQLVKIISTPVDHFTASSVGEMIEYKDKTIKIEGMEKLSAKLHASSRMLSSWFNHIGPVTCHLFIAHENSSSFDSHTDPDDVLIYMVEGEKTVLFKDIEPIVIKAGDGLFIPYGIEHQIINHKASLMLSFGLERFLLEKL